MDKSRMEKFMQEQMSEINKYKKKREEEEGCDLGDLPVYEWINANSERFRDDWESRNS